MELVLVELGKSNELSHVEKYKTLKIYNQLLTVILGNDLVIQKVENLLQASTNSANDHYCRWKADKRFHFQSFITALPFFSSPPLSLLSIYCPLLCLWLSKSGKLLPRTLKVLPAHKQRNFFLHQDYNNMITKQATNNF